MLLFLFFFFLNFSMSFSFFFLLFIFLHFFYSFITLFSFSFHSSSSSPFFLFLLPNISGTLAFGNSVYLLLNVGFIQMLKSFTPVIIMITAYFARIENPTRCVMSLCPSYRCGVMWCGCPSVRVTDVI